MPSLCHPHDEDSKEDGNRFIFLKSHLSHRLQFLTKALHTTFDLRNSFFRFEREDDLYTYEPAYQKQDHSKRKGCNKPVRIHHGNFAVCSDKERHSKKVCSRTSHEGTCADIDLEKILEHEISAEIISVSLTCTEDCCNHHEYRKQNSRLHGCSRDEQRKNNIDDQEAEEYS